MAALPRELAYERHARLLHAVRRACNDAGITQAELAQRLEMRREDFYRMMHGQKRITPGFKQRVAKALGITTKQLMEGR